MQIMNKRIVLLAICAAFTTSLISCGDSNEPVTTNNNSGDETVSSAETADPTTTPRRLRISTRVVLIAYSMASDWKLNTLSPTYTPRK